MFCYIHYGPNTIGEMNGGQCQVNLQTGVNSNETKKELDSSTQKHSKVGKMPKLRYPKIRYATILFTKLGQNAKGKR